MAEHSKPQSILCVTKSTGGIAVYNRELATRLNAEGHQVQVLCLSENRKQYAAELQALGLRATWQYMNRYRVSPLSDLVVMFALVRRIRANPVSAIIAHGAKAGFLTRLAGRLTGTPVIYVMHSMPFLKRVQGRKATLFRQIEKLGTMLGGNLVALSKSMQEHIMANRIAPAERIKVIYTGIDPDALGRRRDRREACRALGLDPERPLVVWAGRLNRQKAPEDFLEAAVLIRESVPKAQFFMAGEGPLGSAVRDRIKELNLETDLIMAPWQDQVAVMLSACHIYVMTSRWEGLPLSLLEAMALECAVVATAVDGVAEAIRHDIDGILVAPGDPAGMARQVVRLLSDEPQRKHLGREARRRVQSAFSISKMVAQWNDLVSNRA